MAPTPKDISKSEKVEGNRIVISGMSGLYPNSRHVQDLTDILYNKVNPVSETDRWIYRHPRAAFHVGKVPEIDLFDAQFFRVHYRMAVSTDPIARKLMEQAYQAIYDAGVSPAHLNGKKVGVYVGNSFSETDKGSFYGTFSSYGFGIAGCSKAMYSNRISYWLNVKGPSYAVDAGCCSSFTALEQAYWDMKQGYCEAAIVGGAQLCLHPHISIQYTSTHKLSTDGKTKSFDQNAAGCSRSEAICVLFLQKQKDALRIYAEVLNIENRYVGVKNNDLTSKFGPYRDTEALANFISNFYENTGISPSLVEYVEACGSANPEADKDELEALDVVFCGNRENPLLVGSVTSNLGYSDCASGLVAVTKVLLGYHKGDIAANLHCDTPRQDVQGLTEGRMQIITDHQKFQRTYTAVNSFSDTGLNGHVLLHGHYKPKDLTRYKSAIPHLVTVSGRLNSSVQKILEELKSNPVDQEQIALLHNINTTAIFGHLARGFTILDTSIEGKTVSLAKKVDYCDYSQRPLCYVYSGMGSQWAGMGMQLLRIPIFSAAIERCHRVLEPKGINIVHIITTTDKSIFDNILHSFVGIAAIQIGLTDILRAVGLVPDFIIGHSAGELGCAYADGCFTAEEMVLAAYYRGLVSLETPFIRGSMAAIGIGYNTIKDMCPPEIVVACHNGPDSCTISGPADIMNQFVSELTAKDIFAKEVPCSNIAYHSKYVAEAGPGVKMYLSDVIKTPKARSKRWLSTSVPEDKWEDDAAKYSSAEYHTNNFINPVLFEETSRLLPTNAVLVEIAPHGLLQAILKRSLPKTCSLVPLTKRDHDDNACFLLEGLGKLFMEGYLPKLDVLYPKVEFPVSTGTPFLSHLVEWMHQDNWNLLLHLPANMTMAATCTFVISIHDDEHSYLRGHTINGKIVYPFAAALVCVWDTLAMFTGQTKKETSVQFSNVHLFAQPILHDQRQLKLAVSLHRGTGNFEVMDDNSKVATGIIIESISEEYNKNKMLANGELQSDGDINLKSDDIYQLLQDRDFAYEGDFRSIYNVNESLTQAQILWNNNWVTFIDGLLQFSALRNDHDGVSEPSIIRIIDINVKYHSKQYIETDGKTTIEAKVVPLHNYICCGGVSMNTIIFRNIPLIKEKSTVIKSLKCIPRFSNEDTNNIWGEVNEENKVSRDREVSLQSNRSGDINSLNWTEISESAEPGILVKVHYAGLNMDDAKQATGIAHYENQVGYGMDFSGVTDRGNRVMGLVSGGAISSRVRPSPELLWPVPEYWSLEDAATVPLAYAQAFYCLAIKAKLRRGMRMLVHGAAGALGQAIISIGLAYDFEIFATVGDIHKKRFLLKLFPRLKDEQIGSSRDDSFGDMVKYVTKGQRCDLIISCVDKELKDTTLQCSGRSGITLDLSKMPNEEYVLKMNNLSQDRAYRIVNFSSVFIEGNTRELKLIHALISEGIAHGYVRPLSRLIYASQDAARALRFVAARRHRGRVLIHLQDFDLYSQPRINCTPNLCHVVFSQDELGLMWVERLIARGVRTVVIHSNDVTNKALYKVRLWQQKGVDVTLTSEDLNRTEAIASLFNDCIKVGPVEGVYVITSTENHKLDQELITQLDVTSKELCPSLKYFAIVTTDSALGQETCIKRAQDQLPATKVYLHGSSKIRRHTAVDVVEKVLCSGQSVFVAYFKKTIQQSLLSQIADISGYVQIRNEDDLLLESLDNEKISAILNLLRDKYNIYYDESQVKNFTVNLINSLDRLLNSSTFNETVKGLEHFYSYVDPDELMATTETIFLPTLVQKYIERDLELQVFQRYLCIIPGLEGHYKRFSVLCERLKMPAMVLQPGVDKPYETIPQMAERYSSIIMKNVELNDSTFYLVGYECGILVALETARILEDLGLTGIIYWIGAMPEEIQTKVEKEIEEYSTTKEDLEDAVIDHIFLKLGGDINARKVIDPNKCSSSEEKVEACMRTLLGSVKYSAQYARAQIETAISRIEHVRKYKPDPTPLRSRIVLLQASDIRSSGDEIMSKYSQQPITVYNLSAPLAFATEDLRCASIINRHLDEEIIEAFDKKNLCNPYLIDDDMFTSLN